MSFLRRFFSVPLCDQPDAPADATAPQLPASAAGSFFTRTDWAAFWTGTLTSFLVYFFTCAPSVTLEDSGELAVAGDYAGVPHPPGYPSWTLSAWLFARLLSWVTFRGQPNPAWAIAVMSAFWGAIAIGLTAMLICRSCDDLLRARRRADEALEPPAPGVSAWARRSDVTDLICWLSGSAGALLFAFSPVMWSQCTIVEVYSFNAFFLMLVLLLTYRWMCRPSNRLLIATAFFFGLGLTNYQVLLLALVPLILVILLQDLHLFRDFVLAGLPFALGAFLLKLAANYSMPGFPKYPPLDYANPVVGSLALGAQTLLVPHTPAWERVAAYTARFHAFSILAVLVFAAAGAVLGVLSLRKNRSQADAQRYQTVRPIAGAIFALGALGMTILAFTLDAAPIPPEFRYATADSVFRWTLPTLTVLAGIAALFVFALFTPGALWFAGIVSGIELFLFILIRKGALLGLTHPLSGYFAAYAALGVLFLVLAWLLLPNGRTVSLSFLAGGLGLAFYLYMPLAGDTCPPMNWGYPRTWEGFKHAISRGQYEQIVPTAVFEPTFLPKLGTYFSDLRMQFTLLLAPFGFLTFCDWLIPGWVRRRKGAGPLAVLPWLLLCAAAVAALTALDKISGTVDLTGNRIDKIFFLPILLGAAVGLHALIVRTLLPLLHGTLDAESPFDRSQRVVCGVSVLGILFLLFGLALGFTNTFAETILQLFSITPGVAAYGVSNFLLTACLFFAWLAAVGAIGFFGYRKRPVIRFPLTERTMRWHLATFTCFVMMSFVLIALANPRGDIQDAFIQKVKFIASHGIFALWIGYGLAYLLESVRSHRALLTVCAVAVAASPLIPIHQNYFNFRLADTTSAAEQNGHDFGWQFGNYQLRGAAAITEELSEDEEPLPNPTFPEEMTPNAIFFGGTDPGRFVPTYMIYSANVRPDIFLITQNALADNTYLDSMRSLYADDIWMPTTADNSIAFSQYTEDVRAGRRANLGGISVDASGRVSVNGAQAVMEINGILAEQLFRHNKASHDFYVEESYSIAWMYPYLTPHGLIMKLNAEPAAITKTLEQADMDFWDWYSRRLLASPKFGRDLPARKSFNKLRSSIAGVYAARGNRRAAERAFKEAQALYVYSPETALRLIQEVLLPENRYDEAVAQLEQLKLLDPNNTRLPLGELVSLRDQHKILERLSKRLKDPDAPLTEAESLTLIRAALLSRQPLIAADAINDAVARGIYSQSYPVKAAVLLLENGLPGEGARLLTIAPENLLTPDLVTHEQLCLAADYLLQAREIKHHQELSRRILQREPNDWKTWINFAISSLALNDIERAKKSLDIAVSIGGDAARSYLQQQDPALLTFQQTGRFPAAPAAAPNAAARP